ncbi:MAG: trp operon repressor [Clostridioides sp.]|jgi:response regulator of citrate/malate metabolism|nr:trp operon repressor [Clostridioides sp.]
MALFKSREKNEYEYQFNKKLRQMKVAYEQVLQKQQKEIDYLKSQLDKRDYKSYLKPKEKQIRDVDIENIKRLRTDGLSYREISEKTNWSKATISRVLNGMYDIY